MNSRLLMYSFRFLFLNPCSNDVKFVMIGPVWGGSAWLFFFSRGNDGMCDSHPVHITVFGKFLAWTPVLTACSITSTPSITEYATKP